MKILKYKYFEEDGSKWDFQEVDFKRINLIVGNSGSGKTRFVNTIFNLGGLCVGSVNPSSGHWKIDFEHKKSYYHYELNCDNKKNNGSSIITKEVLYKEMDNERINLIDRKVSDIKFDGKDIPKINANANAVYTLKENESIAPVYEAFMYLKKRDFTSDVLQTNTEILVKTKEIDDFVIKNIYEIFFIDLNLHDTLYLLKKYYKDLYNELISNYINIFSFIKKIEIKDSNEIYRNYKSPTKIPIVCIMEKGSDNWISINNVSSGMKKVLLILTDLYTLPNGSVYIIDEYENSMGINAINFLPDIWDSIETDFQLFITSHHPNLINSVDPKDWYVFNRKNTNVKIRFGQDNVEKYGKSRHDKFFQLLNDPFYNEGIR